MGQRSILWKWWHKPNCWFRMSHPLLLPYACTKLAGVCRRIHGLALSGGSLQRSQGCQTWRGPHRLLGQEGSRRNSKRAGVVCDGRGPVRLGLQSRLLITCLPGFFSFGVPVGLIYGLLHFIQDVLGAAGRISWCCFSVSFQILAHGSLWRLRWSVHLWALMF